MPKIAGVLSNDERHAQMQIAINHGFLMIRKKSQFSDRRIQLVCYGPSLLKTWKNLDTKKPIVTVSGAHDFLVERGITPNVHIDCDPRPHKAAMLKRPSFKTKYMMASVCHPDFWATLKDHNVNLWHLVNGEDFETQAWVREHHPQGIDSLIYGNSTVGMRALEVCAGMGFRRFDIHGMDCSFDGVTHAGEHLGKKQDEILAYVGAKPFKTSPQMLQAAREMERFIQTMDADITFYGDGLMQETARFINHQKAA